MEARIIKLASGKTVKADYGSYVVEQYESGQWRREAVYPPTKIGYEEAKKLMNSIDNDCVRIQQYF